MEFTNKFRVPLPLEDAWKLMLDVPRILPCLPGARLTEVLGDNKYRGSVAVKLGPIKLAFDGQAELVKKDDLAHVAWLEGSGLDPKGRGTAQSQFSFALRPVEGGTEVTVTTQLQLSGAVAQYGRGSGMIAEIASHILAQFERNLSESLSSPKSTKVSFGGDASRASDPPVASIANGPTSAYSASGSREQAPPISLGDAQTLVYQAQALLGQAQAVLASSQEALLRLQGTAASPQQPAKPKAAKEINMLSIGLKALWWQIRNFAASLFGRHR